VELHDSRGLYVLRLGRVLEMGLSTLVAWVRLSQNDHKEWARTSGGLVSGWSSNIRANK
jgi:hypothetical protein